LYFCIVNDKNDPVNHYFKEHDKETIGLQTGWSKPCVISVPYRCNCSRYNDMGFSKLLTEFKRTKTRLEYCIVTIGTLCTMHSSIIGAHHCLGQSTTNTMQKGR